jgi:DNA-binding response OmpR family regulator
VTRILIVEDDLGQSKALTRAIQQRRPEFIVLTSPNGRHAITVLEKESVDLVLTDLQMSDMDGFALLDWLSHHRPSVLAFSMTAYGDEETDARLSGLNSLECFLKPLDVEVLLSQLCQGLSENVRGHVQNVSLASLLQLMEMEQKTCTLTVKSEDGVGTLFLKKGQVLDARLPNDRGVAAALTILAWPQTSITIDGACKVSSPSIDKPLNFLLMEAMRVRDEELHAAEVLEPVFDFPAGSSDIPMVRSSLAPAVRPLAPGVLATLVVELQTGAVLCGQTRAGVRMSDVALAAAEMLRQERRAIVDESGQEDVSELVINTRMRSELIRPLDYRSEHIAVLVFDPADTNLAMARHELQLFAAEYLEGASASIGRTP